MKEFIAFHSVKIFKIVVIVTVSTVIGISIIRYLTYIPVQESEENIVQHNWHFLTGKTYDDAGHYDQALAMYEKSIVIHPNDAEAHLRLAIIYGDYLHKNKKAKSHYKQFLSLNPDDPKAELVRQWITELGKSKDGDDFSQASLGPESSQSELLSLKISQLEEIIQNQKLQIQELQKQLDQTSKREKLLDRQSQEVLPKLQSAQYLENQLRDAHKALLKSKLSSSSVDYQLELYKQKESEYKKKIEDSEILVNQFKESNTRLSDQNQLLKYENNEIKNKFASFEQKIQDLESQGKILEENHGVSESKQKIKDLEDEVGFLNGQLKNLKIELETKGKVIEVQSEEIELAKQNKLELTRNVNIIQSEKDEEIQQLTLKLKSLESVLKEKKRIVQPSIIVAQPTAQKVQYIYYRVKQGESLQTIAANLLGNQHRWKEIYDMNRTSIKNPDILIPGQVLKVPNNN